MILKYPFSGPNAEHRQLQIGFKDSPIRGATGDVAHSRRLRNAFYILFCFCYYYCGCVTDGVTGEISPKGAREGTQRPFPNYKIT